MRVLVIEDDDSTRLLLTRLLGRRLRCEVLEASTGPEGLALVEQEQPDLLILDLELPGLNGDGLLAELRGRPETREMPVVAVSAVRDRDRIVELTKLGLTDYLVKPLDLELCLSRLTHLIDTLSAQSAENVIET